MSAKVMGQVYDYKLAPSEREVLMAIADHADHNGENAFPSLAFVAWKLDMTERGVWGIVRRLRQRGALVETRSPGYHRPTTFRVVLGALERKVPFHDEKGEPRSSMKDEARSPLKDEPRSTMKDERDDAIAPEKDEREGEKDERARSYKPSVEPSNEPSKNLSRAARASAIEIPTRLPTQSQIKREQHRFGKEAERVWLQTTAKVGSPYSDRGALRMVHEHAIASTRWASEEQVLVAIRRRMDAMSSPRRIPEWARLEVGEADAREHRTREMAERAATDARLRAEPIDPRVLEELKTATRATRMAGIGT